MAFLFYLDSQLTDQPDNDTALVTTINRDSNLGGFLTTQDVTLLYSGNNLPAAGTISGYTYLKSAFDSGTCNEVTVTIYDQVSATETYHLYSGVMKVPAMTILEGRVQISTKIDDNSFYSYINNNKDVPFNLKATKSKNGETVTPPPIYDVDMFVSFNGVYLSTIGVTYKGYRIYDILKFLIPALSDNKVTFESNILLSSTTQLFIFDGLALANPNYTTNIDITFAEIVRELFKLKNVLFYIDQTNPAAPVFRLEDASFLYVPSVVYSFDEPFEIKDSIKTTNIFGTINVGADYNPSGPASSLIYTWNAGTSYFGWKEETYIPLGQCNTDQVLDLVNEWKIASNAINDQVGGVTTQHLDENFAVECENVDDVLFTAKAVSYEVFGITPERFYNVGLNNVNKINLHNGNFQSALTNSSDVGADICHISLGLEVLLADYNPGGTGSPSVVVPIIFADEFGGDNYDGGANWNNIAGYYTTPLAGNYSFKVTLKAELLNCKSCTNASIRNINLGPITITTVVRGVRIKVDLLAYEDITLTTLVSSSSSSVVQLLNGNIIGTLTLAASLPLGAIVFARVTTTAEDFAPFVFGNIPLGDVQPIPFYIYSGCSYNGIDPNRILWLKEDSTFECNGTPDGGLILAPAAIDAYKTQLHEFEYDINATDFRDIQALPIGLFDFTKDGVTRQGYIEKLQYNNWTGRTQVKLISNATS